MENQGDGEAQPVWYDLVYFSTDDVWDNQDTDLGVYAYRTEALAAGASYSETKNVTLPWVAAGDYYLIVRTDRGNSVYEANEANNDRAVAIAIQIPEAVTIPWLTLQTEESISLRSPDFSPEGVRLVAAGGSRAFVWDTQTSELRGQFTAHTGQIDTVDFSPLGDQVLSGARDGTSRIWDAIAYEQIRSFPSATNQPNPAVWSPDARGVFAGSGLNLPRLWDVATGEELLAFSGHTGAVNAVAMSPDGSMTLTGSSDKTAIVWDTDTAARLLTFSRHTAGINSVAFSWDGAQALAASDDGSIRIWNLVTGDQTAVFIQGNQVVSAAFSPDGRYVVSCGWESPSGGVAYLWEVSSGAAVRTFSEADQTSIRGVAISPDGTLIATTHSDGRVRLWESGLEVVAFASIASPLRSGSILAGDTLRFAAYTRAIVGGGRVEYQWDFGDGMSSTLEVPGLITYSSPGEKVVKLSATLDQYELTPTTRAITVVPDVGSVPDLTVKQLNVPASLAISQPAEISYSVQNVGEAVLSGKTWRDAIYLSRDPYLDVADRRLASALVSKEVAIGATYTNSMTVTIPLLAEGAYHLLVSIDDEWQLLERHQLNNEFAVATDLLVPRLADAVPFTGRFSRNGDQQYFRIDVPAGQNLFVRLDDADDQGANEIYLRFGALPTRGVYDYRADAQGSADQELLIPAATAGTWYVLAYAESVPTMGDFAIEVLFSTLQVTGVVPCRQAGTADAVLTITGAGFHGAMTAELVAADETTYPANTVEVDSFTQITATFLAGSAPVGVYSVRVSRGDDSDALANAFEVLPAGEAKLETNLIVPGSVGPNNPATLYVEYANTGEASMPAPLLVLGPRDPLGPNQPLLSLDQTRVASGVWSAGMPEGFSHSVQFLASGANPGLLQPGESRRVPVYYVGVVNLDESDPRVHFSLGVLTADDTTPVDWAAMKADMRPSYVREDAWKVLWDNFTTQIGATWGDYVATLSRNAVYLYRQGQPVQDITRLLAFAFRQADALSPLPILAGGTDAAAQAPGLPIVFQRSYAQPISRRFELGPLGRGWAHNWQYTLVVRDDGTVVITDMTGTPRMFQPDARPGRPYLAAPGDQGVLLAVVGGGFTLTEANGLVRAFHADGKLDYVEDTNGNRITCEHNGDQLTRLTHSSGQSVTIAYSNGFVSSVTDHYGRQTQYAYDGEHLISVGSYDGRTTTYSYNTIPGAASQHALIDIGLPDGTRRTFTYDARGRLSATARAADAERIAFSYGSEGLVTATDALGNASRFFFDYGGRIVKTENPLGSAVYFDFDELGQLVAVTDPAGRASTFSYDRRGNLTLATDALRQATRFTYSPTLNRLASVTDARGNRTVYAHDLRGNLSAISYADGSSETWTYDARGNPIAWANRRGRAIAHDYDDAGRVSRKTYADGSHMDYHYDARGNLAQAEDAGGTTTFTYNEHDYLTRIDYPASRWLEFTYDDAARRMSSTDQTGRRLDYHYDDAGRLERMTDETGAELVHYAHDAVGRLARKTVGNGVYTDYEYDDAGQLVSLVNRAPDETLISRFDYTYDRRGRRTEMAAHYGTWTYEYDDISQLTRAVLESTDPEIPDQDLTYVYDAVGNRIRTLVNGAEEVYSTNQLNQYIKVGDHTYTYDSDGNLTEEAGPGGVTVYTYNDENRLVGVTRGANAWEYTYDALGNRVVVDANGVVTHYVVDPIGLGNVVGEYDGAGDLVAHYDHGLGLLNRGDNSGSTAYYTFDALDNVSELTGASGVIRNAYAYRPFGDALRHVAPVPNPFEFVGEWGVMAEENGLSYMRARFYEPKVGRFTAIDPIGMSGGDANLYRYVQNSPVLDTDPSGLLSLRGTACVLRIPGLYRLRIRQYFSLWSMIVGRGEYWGWLRDATKDGSPTAPPGYQGIAWRHDWNLHNSRSFALNPFNKDVRAAHSQLMREFVSVLWSEIASFCGSNKDPQDTPQDVPTSPADEGSSPIITARDPNQKTGPAGYGVGDYVAPAQSLAYRMDFENLETATAPAQVVTVSDPLSAHFDWTTFELTEIGFGDELVVVPTDKQQYFEKIVPYSYGGMDFEVHIEAGIHLATGVVFANFYTIDPETELPPPVHIGFLPPEDGTGRGQGHVSYVIRPKANLPTGTAIRNVATIQFDFGLKIGTNQVDPLDPSQGTDPDKECLNTIDADPPASSVAALPASSLTQFLVSWSGDDVGAGVASYDIYVSDNGGDWTLWLAATTDTSAKYDGEVGHTYAFYSNARDNVGHLESPPPQADAATTTIGCVGVVTVSYADGAELSWESLPGYSYIIQSRSDLLTGTWNVSATIPSQGQVTTWHDSDTISTRKFYRIGID